MEGECEKVEERQTLMQAVDRLENNVQQMNGVVNYTERVNRKLNRIEDTPPIDGHLLKNEVESSYTIVELLNNISRNLEDRIEHSVNNLERTLNIID